MRVVLLAALFAPAAFAQFELYVLNGASETRVPAVYSIGSPYAGDAISATFRIRNTSAARATVNTLGIDGAGFALADPPSLPVALEPLAALEFAVSYSAGAPGAFSAVLFSDRSSALLTVTVLSPLVLQVDGGSGLRDVGAAPIDFGTVERGGYLARRFSIVNRGNALAGIPPVTVSGAAFSLAGTSPTGLPLQAGQSAPFDVRFQPSAAGEAQGTLTMGERNYPLQGSARDPSLPKPGLTLDLPEVRSGRQGTVTVRFDAPARTSGTGSLTLEFTPAAGAGDPAVQFATGGRTVIFNVAPGDTAAQPAAFQTGTTAGSLAFTASLGGATDRKTVAIDPAPVTLTAVTAIRSATGVELRLTGFDNARTAGPLRFTFYDSAGAVLAPGMIQADGAADFRSYFSGSNAGGVFLLRCAFPVTGDASRIAAFEAEIANSSGAAKSGRTAVQ